MEVPERTANFAWGDDDFRSLYITASTSLYRVAEPFPAFPRSIDHQGDTPCTVVPG